MVISDQYMKKKIIFLHIAGLEWMSETGINL